MRGKIFNTKLWSLNNFASNLTGTLFVMLVATALRFVGLRNPFGLIFDEPFYQREAYSLLVAGYELQWPAKGAPQILRLDMPAFSVHPPFGKWVIAFFMKILGPNDPLGFRFGPALSGVVTVLCILIACYIITRSILWANFAGLLIAVDPFAVSMSRVAMLDGIMTAFLGLSFVFFAFHIRSRIMGKPFKYLISWLPLVGVSLGLATAVKWSALAWSALFLVIALVMEWGYFSEVAKLKRDSVGQRSLAVLGQILVTGIATYTCTWAGWFNGKYSWGSYLSDYPKLKLPNWLSWIPVDWQPFLLHHIEMATTGIKISSHHAALSPAWQWPLMLKPTLFGYLASPCTKSDNGGLNDCVISWTNISNPLVWYPAVLSLIALVWIALRTKSVWPTLIAGSVLAGFVPWLFITRDEYFFYAIAALPFLILSLVWVSWYHFQNQRSKRKNPKLDFAYKLYVIAALLSAAFFLPLALWIPIPAWFWNLHLWMPDWGLATFQSLNR